MNLNTAIWSPKNTTSRVAFQEVWLLKLNDLGQQKALWLRLNILISRNGFRRIAEAWAINSSKAPNRETSKTALRQTSDLSQFEVPSPTHIKIQDCELSFNDDHSGFTRGSIKSKGNTLNWDLQFKVPESGQHSFEPFPNFLNQIGLIQGHLKTLSENLQFSGQTELNGEATSWSNSPGSLSHFTGSRLANQWIWAHCNTFVDDKGSPAPFLFEGISTLPRIAPRLAGGLPAPKLSAFSFVYQGKRFAFNSFWTNLRTQSKFSLTDWQFQADMGSLSFRGQAKTELKDFVGLTFEDTTGALIYGAFSQLSDLKIHVYQRGKIESSFSSSGIASYSWMSNEKNPYVPILL